MPTVYIIESDITAIWPHQFIFNINPVVQDKHQLKILRHLNGFSPKPNDVVVIWFQADGCLHANKLDFVSKLAFDPTFDEIQIFVGVQPGYAREMLPKGYMDQNKKRKTSGRVTMITPPERAAFSILVEQVKNYLLGPNSEELSQKVDLLEGCKDRYLTTDTIEAYQPNDSNFLVTIYGSCKRTAYRPKIMNILTEKYHGDKDVFCM